MLYCELGSGQVLHGWSQVDQGLAGGSAAASIGYGVSLEG